MAADSDVDQEKTGTNSNFVSEGHVLEEFKEIKEVKAIVDSMKNICNDQIAVEMAIERFTFIMDKYQEQPHLLDPHLEDFLGQMLDIVKNKETTMPVIHLTFKCLYLVSKVRGFKIIVRLMPHEVADLEPVLGLLAQQDPTDHDTWETRYVLLLWLSMVCMIPFDMVRLDSNIRLDTGETRKPIMDRIMDTAKLYLGVNDKSLDAAAYVMSRFMTRPDVKKQKLPEFLDWALTVMHTVDCDTIQGMSAVRGVLATLAALFKHGKREDLMDYAPIVLQKLGDCDIKSIKNAILRKLAVKLVQRIGLTFLKFKVASWRYQRGNRSLMQNLSTNNSKESKPRMVQTELEDDDEDEYDIPDEIEDVIEQLLNGLKDTDTIVRWSAAKGIGRTTGRLPQELADEVVGSVLELFSLRESDTAWHGGCLALAELGRRGLLVPERLSEVVPVVLKALTYDVKRGKCSVGAHVRDAACYVCWAFARAYDPPEIKPYVNDIASALVVVSIFDREVNVRRAASAAFQENVGRQGSFPHGIDILTTCDYFAVGNLTNCYLELSVFVANFPEYTEALIDHLSQIKANHWDQIIRELTSKALYKLTACAPEYMAKTVLPFLVPLTTGIDLYTRHGAILATAEITQALHEWTVTQGKKVSDILDTNVIDGMRNVVLKLQEAKLFRGLGGELMRKAVSCLIDKLSQSLPFHDDSSIVTVWQDTIDDCLQHIEPEVQAAAITAIPAFFTEYYRLPSGGPRPEMQDKILEKYLGQLKSTVETTRMGYALALGALPKFMISEKLKTILGRLITCSKISQNDQLMAESRRDAVKAITSMFQTVGVETNGSPDSTICKANISEVYDALFEAMTDYTLDSRGDVGAWVREASMTALQDLTILAVKHNPDLIVPEITKKVFCCLVQQCLEKIDRTRAHAGETFCKLLFHKPEIPHIFHKEELMKIFDQKEIKDINWAVQADTFPMFTKLLDFDTYRYNVLLGLTVSVGGLTESLVKHSGASLHSYLRGISEDMDAMQVIAAMIIQIFKDFQKVDRVSLPLLKMMNQLLGNGTFDKFTSDPKCSFPLEILTLCKQEISKSSNPQKLLASVDVFCGLLQFEGDIRRKSLTQLVIFLCHRYPIVRKTTAYNLYETLLTYEDVVDPANYDDVMITLSETRWDEPVNDIKPIRNNLCDLMNLPKPVMVKKKSEKTEDQG